MEQESESEIERGREFGTQRDCGGSNAKCERLYQLIRSRYDERSEEADKTRILYTDGRATTPPASSGVALKQK